MGQYNRVSGGFLPVNCSPPYLGYRRCDYAARAERMSWPAFARQVANSSRPSPSISGTMRSCRRDSR
jgi:hypothetical protein